MVINAYYPKYIVNNPMVVCRVEEYRRANERVFTVMGLVKKPDAFAGGPNMTADPRYLKEYQRNGDSEIITATFRIDNKSLL